MRLTSILVAALALAGCSSESQDNADMQPPAAMDSGDGGSDGGEAPVAGATDGGAIADAGMDGGAIADAGGVDGGVDSAALPDFALVDANESSPTAGAPVSPRDFLGKVSGWYFTHAT